MRIYISGVTKCVTKFLTLSKSPHCDSVKKFVTHYVTPEIWTLTLERIIYILVIRCGPKKMPVTLGLVL